MKNSKEIRRGWRYFHCSDCSHAWKWPTRDIHSPSGENCPVCNQWEFPVDAKIDESIPCDEHGNLTAPWNWVGPEEK